MTPIQKLKHLILIRHAEMGGENLLDITNADTIDGLYSVAEELWDAKSEVRGGEVVTDIPCDWSRHYESKSVAAKAPDGSWIGWTYWYGGGKHGEPKAIDWIEHAYDLTYTEEQKMVTVQTFAKSA